MRYEHKTVWVAVGANGEHFARAVESEINTRTMQGWEYVDSMQNGTMYGAVLVFRRPK